MLRKNDFTKKLNFLLVISMLVIIYTVSLPITFADTVVPQSGPNPIVFNQTATTDNIQYLVAAGSEHNSSLTVFNGGFPKYFWVNNFGQRNATDYMKWTVSLAAGANYHVFALINAGGGVPFKLTVGGSTLNFSTRGIGWDKLDCGVISIPTGTSTLTFVKNDTNSNNYAEIKALELIRDSDLSAYNSRVASFRKDTTWLATSKYGLMFQYGGWGYPQFGTTRKSLAQGAVDFNVTNFVNMVKGTGAKYVIWSITWWQYWMQAPISSVNNIMGNSTLTESSRDLIGDVASALHAQGIKFCLYYHQGIQQEPTWAAKQNFPSNFPTTGTGDRTTFFNNWRSVITEIGNRYGTNLDGWFFDDGCVYYPAPFEQLGAAARAGNSNRLISWNPWVSARITDFQDVYFAEGSHGETQFGSAPAGGNGKFTDGPHKGLLQQAMFTCEQDWGVHDPNTSINCGINSSQAISWVQSASARNVPLSFNLMMWENGTCSSTTLGVLTALNNAIYGGGGGGGAKINDTDSGITYSGFSYSSGRGYGDYYDDVHYATANNSYFQYTFTGTGIDYITEKNSDQGNVDIYIDNVFQQTVNCYNATRLAQQTVYSKTGLAPGSHTIKGVKTSGTYMLLDALNVSQATQATIYNDTDTGITYSGGTWNYSSNRGAGDYSNDVHYTGTNGAYMQYTFTGTGVDIIAPKDSCQGNVDIYIDNVFQQRINTYNSSYLAQQTIYSKTGLSPGSHTVKMVKVDASWMQLDAIKIY